MSKNFQSFLKANQEQKINSNISEENKRLRSKIEELKHHVNALAEENKSSIIPLSQIKLINNIRNKENYDLEDLKKSLLEIGQLQPVLITKDLVLVAGNRRYTALKELGRETIVCYKLEHDYYSLKEEIEIYQFEENYQRKNLDNFEISDMFDTYQKLHNLTQLDLAKKFNKTKSFISSIIKLQEILPELRSFLKEFQMYAYSKAKFLELQEKKKVDAEFVSKNSSIIGINSLYILAKKDKLNQRKSFFSQYKSRLTDQEIKEYFFDLISDEESEIKLFQEKLKKKRQTIERVWKGLLNDIPKSLDIEKETSLLKAHDLMKEVLNLLE